MIAFVDRLGPLERCIDERRIFDAGSRKGILGLHSPCQCRPYPPVHIQRPVPWGEGHNHHEGGDEELRLLHVLRRIHHIRRCERPSGGIQVSPRPRHPREDTDVPVSEFHRTEGHKEDPIPWQHRDKDRDRGADEDAFQMLHLLPERYLRRHHRQQQPYEQRLVFQWGMECQIQLPVHRRVGQGHHRQFRKGVRACDADNRPVDGGV